MKSNPLVLLVAALCSFSSLTPSASAQGAAFTYQGRLNDGAALANGTYDLQFTIYAVGSGGSALAGPLTNAASIVSNGLFTVTLDFGTEVFASADRWLEIGVRTNGGGAFVPLTPRQRITATPYAMRALSVTTNGLAAGMYANAVTFNNSANSFTGNGGALTNVNAATLGGRSASQFWTTTGNSNTVAGVNFLGTRDNQPLELWAGGLRVLRLEPDTRGDIAGNLIGGASNNAIAQPGSGGSVIGGGGYRFGPNLIHSNSSGVFIGAGSANQIGPNVGDAFIGGGYENRILSPGYRAVIVGGLNNTNGGYLSIIVGGSHNWINGLAEESFIGGGSENQIIGSATDMVAGTIGGGSFNHIFTNGTLGTIAGGFNNNIQAETDGGTIGGGYNGSVAGDYATIPGGSDNWANGFASFAAGRRAKANHAGAFVWADSQDADFSSTATNQFLIRAGGGVGINNNNPTAALHVGGIPGTDGIRFPNGTLQTTAPIPVFNSGYGLDPTTTNQFLALPVTVTVNSTNQRILVTSHKALGSAAPGGANSLNLWIGYRIVGTAVSPTAVGGGIFGNRVPQNTRVTFGLSAVVTGLSPGNYEVGLMGISVGAANWNDNEYSYTTATVY